MDGKIQWFRVNLLSYKIRAHIVVLHLFIYSLLSLCGNSLGLMGGCMFKDVKVAAGVVPMIIMPLVLFSGFFKN